MTEEEERGTEGGVKIRSETNEEERKEWKGLQKKQNVLTHDVV